MAAERDWRCSTQHKSCCWSSDLNGRHVYQRLVGPLTEARLMDEQLERAVQIGWQARF